MEGRADDGCWRSRPRTPASAEEARGTLARPSFITGQISESEATVERWLNALSRQVPSSSLPSLPSPLCRPERLAGVGRVLAGLENACPKILRKR